jgi:hypothetical protein
VSPRNPRFGKLLTWEVLHPGKEHATTYDGAKYRIERASRETVRAWFGHGGAEWFLYDQGRFSFGDGEWGYPLGPTAPEARMLAELKLACPWVVPTCTADAPSITQIFGGIDAVGESRIGMVTCRLVTPTEIGIHSRDGNRPATIRVEFAMPPEPAVAPIRCVWRVEVPGRDPVDAATWDEAFAEATR